MSKTCKCKEKHTPPVNGSPESHTKQAWHRFARFLRKCFLFRFIGRATPLFVLMLVPFAMVLGLGEAFGLPGLFASFRVGGVSILGTYAVIGVCAFLIDVSHDRSFAREVLDPSGALDPESSRDFARLLGRYLLCFTGCWVLLFMVVACVSRAGMFFREQGAGAVVLSLVLLAIVAIGLAMDGRGALGLIRRFAGDAATDSVHTVKTRRPILLALVKFAILACLLCGIDKIWGVVSPGARPTVRVTGTWVLATLCIAGASFYRWKAQTPHIKRVLLFGAVGLVAYCIVLSAIALSVETTKAAISICILVSGVAVLYTVARVFLGMTTPAFLLAMGVLGTAASFSTRAANPGTCVPPLKEWYAKNTQRSIEDRQLNPCPPLISFDPAGTKDRKPLVIVCTSGGGVSAAAWTVTVLAELERRHAEFPYLIRVITGASGGMLGAAYYVATLDPPSSVDPQAGNNILSRSREAPDSGKLKARLLAHRMPPKVLPDKDGKLPPGYVAVPDYEPGNLSADRMINIISADALSPVARLLALHDIPDAFIPGRPITNRGVELEDAFKRNTFNSLSVNFQDLYKGEAEGWRPSLIFSPVMVEDGRRLLISNLNLEKLTSNHLSEPGAMNRPTSYDAVELFAVYPEAREKMTLAAAARLSAGFPFVSPAVKLPFNEKRRAVDAGYFDNHGVELACRWLYMNRDWVEKSARSVLILQIRTYKRSDGGPSRVTPLQPLEELSAPFDGAMAARQSAMNYRNDRDIQTLTEAFADSGRPSIKTITIECPSDQLPLTWLLSDAERDGIAKAINDDVVKAKLDAVGDWLAGGSSRAWEGDRVIKRLKGGEQKPQDGSTPPAAPCPPGVESKAAAAASSGPVLRYAISEDEVSSWMLFRDGARFAGFEPALVREICARLQGRLLLAEPITAVEVGPVPWEDMMALPKRGKADLALSSLSFEPEREHWNELRFSIPYFVTGQAVAWLAKTDERPPTLSGLIAVQENTTSDELMQDFKENPPPGMEHLRVREYESLKPALLDLRPIDSADAGALRFVLTDEPYTTLMPAYLSPSTPEGYQVRWRPLRDLVTLPARAAVYKQNEYYCVGVADDCPQLLWLINSLITEMHHDGTLDRLKREAIALASKTQGSMSQPGTPRPR